MLLYNALTILIIAILSGLLTYVVTQNTRAEANRLFGYFTATSLLVDAGSLIQQNSTDPLFAMAYGDTLPPLLSINLLLLFWLILAVFLPERYAQPWTRWLIAAPTLLSLAVLLQAPLTGLLRVFVGVHTTKTGAFSLTIAPGFHPLLGAYILGNYIAIILAAAIAVRHKGHRIPAAVLCGGMLFSQVLTGSTAASQNPIFYIIGPLPIYVAFAWITMRYQFFRPSAAVFQSALDRLPDGVLILNDAAGVRYANATATAWLNPQHEIDGQPLSTLLDQAALHRTSETDASASGRTRYVRAGAPALVIESTTTIVQEGRHQVQVLVLRDVTQQDQQAAALTLQNAEQRRLLDLVAMLETPAITLSEGVLLAPIAGTIDNRRAQRVMERLLAEVSSQRARQVVLDIAGVSSIDTAVAQALIQMVRALQLLGCRVTITGIAAGVAHRLALLGIDLDGVEFARSPQEVLGGR